MKQISPRSETKLVAEIDLITGKLIKEYQPLDESIQLNETDQGRLSRDDFNNLIKTVGNIYAYVIDTDDAILYLFDVALKEMAKISAMLKGLDPKENLKNFSGNGFLASLKNIIKFARHTSDPNKILFPCHTATHSHMNVYHSLGSWITTDARDTDGRVVAKVLDNQKSVLYGDLATLKDYVVNKLIYTLKSFALADKRDYSLGSLAVASTIAKGDRITLKECKAIVNDKLYKYVFINRGVSNKETIESLIKAKVEFKEILTRPEFCVPNPPLNKELMTNSYLKNILDSIVNDTNCIEPHKRIYKQLKHLGLIINTKHIQCPENIIQITKQQIKFSTNKLDTSVFQFSCPVTNLKGIKYLLDIEGNFKAVAKHTTCDALHLDVISTSDISKFYRTICKSIQVNFNHYIGDM